jgi:hypothetical protein
MLHNQLSYNRNSWNIPHSPWLSEVKIAITNKLRAQQYLFQQMHNLILIQSKLGIHVSAYLAIIRTTITRNIENTVCQNKEVTLKVVWYVAICKMSCVCVIGNAKSWIVKNVSSCNIKYKCTRWFKYDRDWLCVNKSQFVPVIFEPSCMYSIYIYKHETRYMI